MRIKHKDLPEKFINAFLSFHRFEKEQLCLVKKNRIAYIENETIAHLLGKLTRKKNKNRNIIRIRFQNIRGWLLESFWNWNFISTGKERWQIQFYWQCQLSLFTFIFGHWLKQQLSVFCSIGNKKPDKTQSFRVCILSWMQETRLYNYAFLDGWSSYFNQNKVIKR